MKLKIPQIFRTASPETTAVIPQSSEEDRAFLQKQHSLHLLKSKGDSLSEFEWIQYADILITNDPSTTKDVAKLLFDHLKQRPFQDQKCLQNLILALTGQSPYIAEYVAKHLHLLKFDEGLFAKELAQNILLQGEWAAQALARSLHYLPLDMQDLLQVGHLLVSQGAPSAQAFVENLPKLTFKKNMDDHLYNLFKRAINYGGYTAESVAKYLFLHSSMDRDLIFSLTLDMIRQGDDIAIQGVINHLATFFQMEEDILAIRMLPNAEQSKATKIYLNGLEKRKKATGENTPIWEELKQYFPNQKDWIFPLFLSDLYEHKQDIPDSLLQSLHEISPSSPAACINVFHSLARFIESDWPLLIKRKRIQEISDENSKMSSVQLHADQHEKSTLTPWYRHFIQMLMIDILDTETLEKGTLKEGIESTFLQVISHYFPGVTTADNVSSFLEVFAVSRNPFALLILRKKLDQLPDRSERYEVTSYLNLFVEEVLQGTYKNAIYSDSEHLDLVFSHTEDEQIQQIWKKGHRLPLSEIILEDQEKETGVEPRNISKFFHDTIQHGHLDSILPPKLRLQLKERGINGVKPINFNALSPAQKTFVMTLQQIASEKVGLTQKYALISQLLQNDNTPVTFLNDLKALLRFFQNKPIPGYEEYTVEVAHNPIDMLLSGTDIEASCQNVNGDPKYTKCLLAPLLDGKTQMISAKDQYGTIQTRCFLRILWDKKLKRPVLFLEPFYYNDKKLKPYVNEMGKIFADMLKIPLYGPVEGGEEYPPVSFFSLFSRAPFEYADSAPESQHKNNGCFEIIKAKQLS